MLGEGRPFRHRELLRSMRQEIVSGTRLPGSRLPTRLQMIEELQASPGTVQRALDRLIQDGFIESRGKRGTFVTNHPPHLYQYGVAFWGHPSDGVAWSRFWDALDREAGRPSATPEPAEEIDDEQQDEADAAAADADRNRHAAAAQAATAA